jgi:Tfp pilus assembly protein PilF
VLETYIHLAGALTDAAPERAAEALQKALFLDPHHWYAAFELAKIHAHSGERRRAKITFSQVLEGLEQRRRPLFDERLIGESLSHVEETRDEVRVASIAALESLITQ